MISGLDAPMNGEGCRAELFTEAHHEALKAACAEDRDIWAIYANNFGPDGFDAVLSRALATARKAHPALAHVRIEPRSEARLTELATNARTYRLAELHDALQALLAAMIALLTRLIGDDLVRRLLQEAWPQDMPNDMEADARPEDTRMTEHE